MGKDLVDMDDGALARAAELFGTNTNDDTVNAALRDAAERRDRLAAFDRLGEMAEAGDLDDLLDKRNYRR